MIGKILNQMKRKDKFKKLIYQERKKFKNSNQYNKKRLMSNQNLKQKKSKKPNQNKWLVKIIHISYQFH